MLGETRQMGPPKFCFLEERFNCTFIKVKWVKLHATQKWAELKPQEISHYSVSILLLRVKPNLEIKKRKYSTVWFRQALCLACAERLIWASIFSSAKWKWIQSHFARSTTRTRAIKVRHSGPCLVASRHRNAVDIPLQDTCAHLTFSTPMSHQHGSLEKPRNMQEEDKCSPYQAISPGQVVMMTERRKSDALSK